MKRILLALIRLYQSCISAYRPSCCISAHRPSCCRFYPTCSEYAKQAIARHGAVKGFIMGFCRILRCNPFSAGGFDYVPKKFEWKKLFAQNKVDETRRDDNY